MKRRPLRRFTAGFAGLALVLAACGGDDDGDDGDDAAPATEAPADDDAADDDAGDDDAADDDAADDDADAGDDDAADDDADAGDDDAGDDDADAGDGGGGTDYDWDGSYPDPGVDDERILLGTSGPLSGPASAYGAITGGYEVCVNYVNEELGGIEMADGVTRELEFEIYDDAYDPANTVENVRRLNEQDGVFAMVGVLGTPPNTAIIDYVEDEQFPNLFVATGASRWGTDFVSGEYEWTIGWQPAYPTESAVYVEYLEENHPGSTVAILQQNDDYGRDYADVFKNAAEGTSIEVVAEETYEVADPTVDQQVTELASSEADVFFNVTTPRFAAQAITRIGELGWEPIHLLNNVSASVGGVLVPAGIEASTGILSTQYFKDPTDPSWEDDEAMVEYRRVIDTYGDGADPDDPFTTFMWTQCELLTQLLPQTYPTREHLMQNVANLGELGIDIPILLDGINVSTGPDDGFPLEAMQIVQFNGEYFETVGEPIIFDGETSELIGE